MRRILLSPEFQLYSPIFNVAVLILIVLLLVLAVGIAFLIIRTREVNNEIKSRELLEKIFNEIETGGVAMKQIDGRTMYEEARKGVIPSGASGNQAKQIQGLTGIMQAFSRQSTGMVQKLRHLTVMQEASVEMAIGAQIIESVDSHIQTAQRQFDDEVPIHEATALGNALPEQTCLGASPLVETVTEVSSALRSEAAAPAETPAEIMAEMPPSNATEAMEALRKMGCVKHLLAGSGLSQATFELENLPDTLFEKLLEIFREKSAKVIGNTNVCTEEDKRIYAFLLRFKTERNG